MLLAIDVGNTNTVLGLFAGDQLVSSPALNNARVFVAVNIEGVRLIDNLEIAK